MRIGTLKLSNFQSHRDTVIDFGGIDCAVLIGPNGSGKSTIMPDALLFCLFGETTRGTLDAVVMRGEEVGRVELTFAKKEGEQYGVSRQRSTRGAGKTELSFWFFDGTRDEHGEPGTESLNGKSIADTQARIEEVTGLTAELLKMTAISAQGDAEAFAQGKAVDRKGLLARILGVPRYAILAKAGRDLALKIEAALEVVRAALDSAETVAASRGVIQEQIAAADTEAAELEGREKGGTEHSEELATKRVRTVRGQTADAAARKELVEATSRLTTAEASVETARTAESELATAAAGLDAAQKNVASAQAAVTDKERFDGLVRQREHYVSAGKALAEQITAKKLAHETRRNALDTAIDSARREHEQAVKALTEAIAALIGQEKRLEGLPCTDMPMAVHCDLIAGALAAKEQRPEKERELEALEKTQPWVELETQLAAHRADETAWAALVEERADLKKQYDGIEYDEQKHTAAKETAAGLVAHQEAVAHKTAAAVQLDGARKRLRQAETDRDTQKARVETLSTELGEATDWVAALAALDQEQAAAKEALAQTRRALEVIREKQGALAERLSAAKKAGEEVDKLKAEIGTRETRLLCLRMLSNPRDGAFSPGGIPALLIEQAIPEIEQAANEILQLLSEGALSLELRTQRPTQDGNLSEALDIWLIDAAGPRLYESFSGGERMRAALAIRIALAKRLARQSQVRCELLVCDETAAPLDAAGQAQFVAALSLLAEQENVMVLCVTHLRELEDAFPIRIVVEKGADGSTVEVFR